MKVIHSPGSRPIHIWTDDIQEEAMEQLRSLSYLPFIHPHGVAAMPDVHAGIGSTVGSVIATEKAIIPAAVGVDIGCFRGDTRIPLLDGTQATLETLAKRTDPFWVYSLDKNLQIVPGLAIGLRTRENAELMRVVVSGGEEIICTPDHEFMMRDGSYRQAKDLRFNDSLMPLYRRWQARDGYESVSTGKGGSEMTHVKVWTAINGQVQRGHVIHHRNHIHFDNRPSNLEVMDASTHSAHHRRAGHRFNNTDPDLQAARLAGIARRSNDPDKRKRMIKVGTDNIQRYMHERPGHFAAAVAENGDRGAPYLRTFNVTPRTCDECGEAAKNPAALRWHKHRDHGHNHKVILVEALPERADVYCLQVEEHHNFALAAGVFVHNCGMNAVRTSLKATDLPDSLSDLRHDIERSVPLGAGGAHHADVTPSNATLYWGSDEWIPGKISTKNVWRQLGTLGSGNHFIEVCLDENDDVWVMLHSGSRGIGNQIGRHFIELAKRECERWHTVLPDKELAFLPEGSPIFDAYRGAVGWAQDYALENRRQMMTAVLQSLAHRVKPFTLTTEAVNCHHNYVEMENHFGRNVWVTRKGAIRARKGDLGIIPGSMGTRSYIVRGKGNPDSYCSCSHGAGRRMSRTEARRRFTAADVEAQTAGVECRKDKAVIDEIPGAYKDVDKVMAEQTDLVEIVHTLRAVLCVKGA